jgi:hypothetical protein
MTLQYLICCGPLSAAPALSSRNPLPEPTPIRHGDC